MRLRLLICISCLFCFACASGSKNSTDPYTGSYLKTGGSVTIAVLSPFALGANLTVEYFTDNVASILRPACSAVTPEGVVADEVEGLALARQNGSDYVLFLRVEDWSAGAVVGTRAKLHARFVSVADGNAIAAAAFERSAITVNILYSSGDPWLSIAGDFRGWITRIIFYSAAPGTAA